MVAPIDWPGRYLGFLVRPNHVFFLSAGRKTCRGFDSDIRWIGGFLREVLSFGGLPFTDASLAVVGDDFASVSGRFPGKACKLEDFAMEHIGNFP